VLVNMVGLYTGSLYWGRGLYSEVYDILLSNVSYLNHTIQDNICPPPNIYMQYCGAQAKSFGIALCSVRCFEFVSLLVCQFVSLSVCQFVSLLVCAES
jgi:hypothetical protein